MAKEIWLKICSFLMAIFSLFYLTGIALPIYTSATYSKGLIVIDPGHDYVDPGAVRDGYNESDLNAQLSYKLAKELQNRGYEVWFSHSIFYAEGVPQDIPCLLPEKTDSKYDISTERVPAINEKNPDIAISIHHNTASSSSASGVEVYWRSNGTDPSIHQQSKDLGNYIYRHTSDLDYIDGRYGEVQDSMFLICKTNMPAVLFEAGFMSNPTELQNIINPAQQQKMACALADGVDEYFSKYPSKHVSNEPASLDCADVARLDETSSLVTVYATGVTSPNGISSVHFPTFIPNQTDAIWYEGEYVGNDTWAYTYDGSKNPGAYTTHVYATDNVGHISPLTVIDTINISSTATPKANQAYSVISNTNKTEFLTIANNISVDSGVFGVDMACFAPNSQAPMWHNAKNTGENTFVSNFDIQDFQNQSGRYSVHCYSHPVSNPTSNIWIGNTEANILGATAESVYVSENIEGAGVFRVVAKGVSSPGTITEVKFPVWSAEDQSDIVWYNAKDIGNGMWAADVNFANHKNHIGTYQIHAYAYDDRGTSTFIGDTTTEIKPVDIEINTTIASNYNQSEIEIVASGVPEDVSEVKFPTWTESSGQDDLIWYEGQKASSTVWVCNIPIKNHNYETGLYISHVYATQNSNTTNIDQISILIDSITASSVNVINKDDANVFFQVEVSDVTSPATVTSVQVPVWCAPDQSDIVWYDAKDMGNGSWIADVNIANHQYHTGEYKIHAYATDSRGVFSGIGGTQADIDSITASSVNVINKNDSNGSFQVEVSDVISPATVTSVQVPVWCASDQSDIVWYDAKDMGNGRWIADVNIANHQYHTGEYQIHAYATDRRNITNFIGSTTTNVLPAGTKIYGNSEQSIFTATASGVSQTAEKVLFPVWTEASGQDDLIWYEGQKINADTWTCQIPISNHKYETGRYNINTYVYENGREICLNQNTFNVSAITVSEIQITNIDDLRGSFSVELKGISSPSTVTKVKIPVWCAPDQSDIVWYDAKDMGNGIWVADVSITNHKNHTGTYTIHAYVADARGVDQIVASTSVTISDKTSITGSAQTTVQQMVNYFNNSGHPYPEYYKTNGGAPDIQTFCQIYYEEAIAEGIRPEVAFTQCMKETGFLQFGGDIKVEQFNFAGIGATGNGNPGNSFPNVRIGVRAHVQHLKAYACTDPLNQECVDDRFKYVKRGVAPYVEWLSISSNPYNSGWASDPNYGDSILSMMDKLFQC